MNLPSFSPIVEKALRWSAKGHCEQTRKGSNTPYIAHPCAVAMILQRFGFHDEMLLAAALLHDIVEDTTHTLEDIQGVFSVEVAQYVAALTEEKTDGSGRKRSWEDRKNEHIVHIIDAPWQARAIAIADKYHNLYSMNYDLESGQDIWGRFGASPERVIWYHRSMIDAAYQNDDRLAQLTQTATEMLQRVESQLPTT